MASLQLRAARGGGTAQSPFGTVCCNINSPKLQLFKRPLDICHSAWRDTRSGPFYSFSFQNLVQHESCSHKHASCYMMHARFSEYISFKKIGRFQPHRGHHLSHYNWSDEELSRSITIRSYDENQMRRRTIISTPFFAGACVLPLSPTPPPPVLHSSNRAASRRRPPPPGTFAACAAMSRKRALHSNDAPPAKRHLTAALAAMRIGRGSERDLVNGPFGGTLFLDAGTKSRAAAPSLDLNSAFAESLRDAPLDRAARMEPFRQEVLQNGVLQQDVRDDAVLEDAVLEDDTLEYSALSDDALPPDIDLTQDVVVTEPGDDDDDDGEFGRVHDDAGPDVGERALVLYKPLRSKEISRTVWRTRPLAERVIVQELDDEGEPWYVRHVGRESVKRRMQVVPWEPATKRGRIAPETVIAMPWKEDAEERAQMDVEESAQTSNAMMLDDAT